MRQTLAEKYFYDIPCMRLGEYAGKIKCPCHYEFWRRVEEVFLDVEGKTIVDAGSGPGLKGITLALAGANVIAIDENKQRLEELRENLSLVERLHGKLSFSVCEHDLRKNISFLISDSIDFILCYEVIEHLDDISVFVQELARILKPGGRLLLTTPNKDTCFIGENERVYGEKLHGHKRAFNADDLITLFNIEGLLPERVFFYKHFLMQACCGIIHKFMIFDKYKHSLPTFICNFFNWVIFPMLNLIIRFEETTKAKANNGKQIFIIFKKTNKS